MSSDEPLDRFTRLACRALGCRAAVLSLRDGDRHVFVSQFDLGDRLLSADRSPLLLSLCENVVREAQPAVVPDASVDPRVAADRALGDLELLGAYVGYPIIGGLGDRLGALLALDDHARDWTQADVAVLCDLAELATTEIEIRAALGDPEGPADPGHPAAGFPSHSTAHAINTLQDGLDVLQAEHETVRASLHRHAITLAHEVRTPLNAIRGLTEGLLGDGAVSADRETAMDLRVIGDAASQALEIVNQELVLATLQPGHAVVRIQKTDALSLLHAVKAIMDYSHSATPGVQLVIEDSANLPTMNSDRGKVAQILRNLVSNALSATESGEVRVSAAHDDSGHLIKFTVKDTGCGIAPPDQARIFEEFVQVNAQPDDARVGFGLPMSRRVARLLGGDVTLDETSDQGTSFTASVAVSFDHDAAGPEVEVLAV